MDARWLRYFIAVAEAGSFSQAARLLGIAQPALSRHVRDMEHELGVPLLIRTARGVVMTDDGERLHSIALGIVRQLDLLPEAIGAQGRVVTGRVVIGIPTSASAVLSKPLLLAALQKFPQVQIHLIESLSGFLDEWVQNGRLDLAVLYDAEPRSNLHVEQILAEELWLVGAPSALPRTKGGIRFRDLAKLPLILPGLAHSHRQLVNRLALKHNVTLNVVAEVDSLHVSKSAVSEGSVFALLGRSALEPELSLRRVGAIPVRDPAIARTISLARPILRRNNRATEEIARLCIEVADGLRQRGIWRGKSDRRTASRPSENGSISDLARSAGRQKR
jgi:LysR family nitrogen assimilation transcriptional regulator